MEIKISFQKSNGQILEIKKIISGIKQTNFRNQKITLEIKMTNFGNQKIISEIKGINFGNHKILSEIKETQRIKTNKLV